MRLLLLVFLLVSTHTAALGNELKGPMPTSFAVAGTSRKAPIDEFKEPRTIIMSLIRTDREPRSWKTLKLWPGAETSHFYTVLQEDGGTITRESNHKILDPKPRDDRPLKERHPNVYILVVCGQWATGPLVAGAVSVLGATKR